MRTWLVDTGPLVAYLDGRDRGHLAVAERLDSFAGGLATTGAVITEAMHLLAATRDGPRLLADLVRTSGTVVYDLCQARELDAAATLMGKHADIPMDFADATLVLLAEALGRDEILTLDRRGFSVFRTRRGRRFQLVLDRSS
jgi:hypothetical protein